jgi:hypothetical protein
VFRFLLLAIVLGLSFELSGLATALGDSACGASCPDDRSGGECPPNCHACNCCSSPSTIPPAPGTSVPLPEVCAAGWFSVAETLASIDPSEILHVPRLALA